MPDFIEIYDDALSPILCGEIIAAFEASVHRKPGRTGGGFDPLKKLSADLHLNSHPEYRDLLNEIIASTVPHAIAYFKKYHFALIAPVCLTVTDPLSNQSVTITHENFAQFGAGHVEARLEI